MPRNRQFLVGIVALTAALSVGCSRKSTMDQDEVRSEIRLARSFAAESESFIDLILRGALTRHFAEGHADYLLQEVEQAVNELGQATAAGGAEDSIRECRNQLNLLVGELSGIRAAIADRDALSAASAGARRIREALEKADVPQ